MNQLFIVWSFMLLDARWARYHSHLEQHPQDLFFGPPPLLGPEAPRSEHLPQLPIAFGLLPARLPQFFSCPPHALSPCISPGRVILFIYRPPPPNPLFFKFFPPFSLHSSRISARAVMLLCYSVFLSLAWKACFLHISIFSHVFLATPSLFEAFPPLTKFIISHTFEVSPLSPFISPTPLLESPTLYS